MAQQKEETITFKADPTLAELLRRVPNRSEFIRKALFAQLDNICPLCQGSGYLTPDQKNHWEKFSKHHHVVRCESCHEYYLSCDLKEDHHEASQKEM
ncbi:hypothetical protein [Sediminispirochaeta bajacaliforniensis]|uniref:hypothetical protein n=1 Tax=Sediminispirochaeta bajacaliforniensis TaxID=148 RepID=UPI00037717F8|nr:hypothetical protein [Sediminispirochaeta bajacaliforniensis]